MGGYYEWLCAGTETIDRTAIATYLELALPLENDGKKAKSPGKAKSTDSDTIANDIPLNDTERAGNFMTLFAVVLVARCHPSSELVYNYSADDGEFPGFIE